MIRASMKALLPLVVVFGAAGCGGSSSSESPAVHGTWTWSSPATSCASIAGAVNVSIMATSVATPTPYEVVVPCGAGQATLALPSPGSYVVVLSLLDGAAQVLDASPQQTVNVTGTAQVSASFDGVYP